MDKKVLAIYYTQSGQMADIMNCFTQPLTDAGITVEKVQIQTVINYDFPWTGKRFFSVMPDCVLGKPAALQPFVLNEAAYDLVIMAYQPWFLSPSIPANSLLHHPGFKKVIKDTPVITISAARNMWLNAFERVRKSLEEAGANLVGNIALVDRHPNPVSFATIFYWMLTGKKERCLKVFPKPGVSQRDIEGTKVYGKITARHLNSNNWEGLQQQLVNYGAVRVVYPLMVIEGKAKYIFAAWARFIVKRKNRVPWLTAFKYYLFIALFIGAPILLTLDAVFLRPFTADRIKSKKLRYLLLNK